MKYLLAIFFFCMSFTVVCGQRLTRTINESWCFTGGKSEVTEIVSVPHTWNAIDATDETNGYFRGKAVYEKVVRINERLSSHSFFVHFEGANQVTELFLNGQHRKLIGTNRHQDYYNKGNALTDEMHLRDLRLIEEMGGNFLRISHYPQDPVVTDFCDRKGIGAGTVMT